MGFEQNLAILPTFVSSRDSSLVEFACLDGAEGLENALNVLLRQILVDGGDVNAVVVFGLLFDVLDNLKRQYSGTCLTLR